jgi:hypothetical protein
MRRYARGVVRPVVTLAFALGIACIGLPSTSAVALPTTTTTLPAAIVAAGNAYARHLLNIQPIPPEAREVTTLPTTLAPNGVVGPSPGLRWAHHLFLLPLSISVDQYVRAHLLAGEKVTETGSGNSPNSYPTYNLGVSLTCASPHITFCGVFYQTTQAKNGQQELRVDVQVVYLPILHVQMPTTGVVTVTGYQRISLANPSSGLTSVVLTQHQALTLRTVIAELKDFGGGMCMEDSQLLKIKIVHKGKLIWSATADECPGVLQINSGASTLTLNDRSCTFWHVVDTFFNAGTANGTKSGSRVCADSLYG